MLDVIELAELGEQYGVSLDSMRRKLKLAGGRVFKIGKKYVIRKVAYLEVIESLEQDALA